MKFVAIVLAALSSLAHANVYKLATITSDIDQDITEYYIETDHQNKIESMRYVTIMPNGGIYKDETIPVEEIISDGIVIVEQGGLDAVKLEVENFNVHKGGVVKLNYLYNGITGVRQTKKLLLNVPSQKYELAEVQGQRINRMFFKANRTIVGVVGVKYIETSYQDKNAQ